MNNQLLNKFQNIKKKVEDLSRHRQKLVAKDLTEKDKEALPDSVFGWIFKDKEGHKVRKYPMPDKEHVEKAIQLFRFVKESARRDVAKKIEKMAKKFSVKIGEDSLISKYL